MHRRPFFVVGLVVALVVLYPVLAVSNGGGPAPGHTGAPNPNGTFEMTCGTDACHQDSDNGPGAIAIDAPQGYVPGAPLDFTVRVDESDRARFGFQATVKDSNNEHVGTLVLLDANATRFTGSSSLYVTHRAPGTFQNAWTVRWLAPPTNVGDVTIYAAGNASNASGDRFGDHIYTTSRPITAGTATATEASATPGGFTLEPAYPNPFITQTTIGYTLPRSAPVTLTLYDALGRSVRVLALGPQAAGLHQVHLEAAGLTAGLYLYELRTPEARQSRVLMVLK